MIAVWLWALTACCPIPIMRDVSVRPELTVVVTNPEDELVDKAAITVRRYISGPPPDTETHRWKGATGPKGKVTFEAIVEREPTMPLMMHGVNWYSWEVCAEHPKYGVASGRFHATQPVEPVGTVTLQLDPGKMECAWEPM